MQELFRTGRFSLLVGLIVLSVCLMLGLFLSQKFQKGPFPDIFREGFLILGWVAIWRPSEIFLYAWPPLLRRRKLFERLMQARVTVECGRSG
jgi:ABC-type spermidine/putrescine transport system permease subunit I